MKLKLMLSALALVFATGANSSNHVCEGFVPENDLKIPVGKTMYGVMNNGGLTEAQFNAVIDRAILLYSDVIKAKGGTLKVNRLWTDETVNASATQAAGVWEVNMYGGLARHADITVEGFALVICHEIGHHVGGAPKVNNIFGMNAWATNEGGSDYFAGLKCLRQFFADEDNASIVTTREVEPAAKELCAKQFAGAKEQALCERISLAGQSVAYLFQALRKETVKPSYSTPDTKEVTKMNDNHPDTQCRMDTYLAGTVCAVPLSTMQDDKDANVGTCVQGTDAAGFRPRCWFKPANATGGGGEESSCPLGSDQICEMACQFSPSLPFCKPKTIFH